jgi:transposase
MKITTVGLDIAKSVFHFYGVNSFGKRVQKKMLKRNVLAKFMAQLEPCMIVMEACGGANYWARVFSRYGHQVKLIAPQFVVPFRRGNKNDYNDAQAIAEAALRPGMQFVLIKNIEQQDIQMLHRIRQRLVKQCTALVNQVRGMLMEYGVVTAEGKSAFRQRLPDILEDGENELTPISRALFSQLRDEFITLEEKLASYDKQIQQENKINAVCQRLDTVPGIGPITATAIYAAVGDGKDFKNGRHFSAWCGLVPKQYSSGGKNNLLGISKRGNAYLRTLLIHGSRAVLQNVATKDDRFSRWARDLKERRGFNVACVAVANKLARTAWVVMAREEAYRPSV